MTVPRSGFIKKSQKESLLKRVVSQLLFQASLDYPAIRGLTVTRITLSANKGMAFVFLYTPDGPTVFKEKLETLKLLAPSLRKALATEIKARYTPEIRFKFDDTLEKLHRIESILDQISKPEKHD